MLSQWRKDGPWKDGGGDFHVFKLLPAKARCSRMAKEPLLLSGGEDETSCRTATLIIRRPGRARVQSYISHVIECGLSKFRSPSTRLCFRACTGKLLYGIIDAIHSLHQLPASSAASPYASVDEYQIINLANTSRSPLPKPPLPPRHIVSHSPNSSIRAILAPPFNRMGVHFLLSAP